MSDFEKDNLEARDPEYECACTRANPEEEYYYGIGSTTPPKDYTAVVSVVLMLLISICGVLSALSLMDIHLFAQMRVQQAQSGTSVLFAPSKSALPSGLEQAGSHPNVSPEIITPGGMELQLNGIPEPETQPAAGPDETTPDGTPQTLPPEDPRLTWQEVYEKVIPSVVTVLCTDGNTTTCGSGVILDHRGYIVTSTHLVEQAIAIQVMLWDGRTITARCLGMDAASDLAVLYIQAENLIPAELADSSTLRVGDEVVAIGNPFGVELRGTMTDGIVSAIHPDLVISGRTLSLLQTTAAMSDGNSGGPLVNCYGQVVGINTTAIGEYTNALSAGGVGFTIPMSCVKSVVEQLAEGGYVAGDPDLGLEGERLSSFFQNYYRLPSGMLITSVAPDSAAYACGIREGDIVLYVNGCRITDEITYHQALNAVSVGQKVSIVIYRSGKEYELTLTAVQAGPTS